MVTLEEAWQRQIAWCDANGSPFNARVLEAAWADRERGGALATLLPDWPGDAGADAVPLRLTGALHALALSGLDNELAVLYPPRAAGFDAQRAPAAISRALATHASMVARFLALAPQTNEIGRSAALLIGFAAVAVETGLPLATLEIGASAGLNQLWPRFRYELGPSAWGNASSPVRIGSQWRGAPPVLPPRIGVASQAACDLSPISVRDDGEALRLAAYVWPDQHERLARLRAAIVLAREVGVRVERSDALPWVERRLAERREGQATVLYHSVMWQYMPEDSRNALRAVIESAGARASTRSPLAWLAFEPPAADAGMELSLVRWPGGEHRVLARAHPHGAWIEPVG